MEVRNCSWVTYNMIRPLKLQRQDREVPRTTKNIWNKYTLRDRPSLKILRVNRQG